VPTSKRLFVFGASRLLVVAVVLFAYFGTEIRRNEPQAPKGPSADTPVFGAAPSCREVVPFRPPGESRNVEA